VTSEIVQHALVAMLRAEILAGRYGAGVRLVEKYLASHHSVSRETVRATVQELVRRGLLERERYHAPMVPPADRDEIIDLISLRMRIEPLLVARFVERATAAQMAQFDTAQREFDQALEIGDPIVVDYACQAFYDILIKGAASWALGSAVERENARLTLFRSQLLGWEFELARLRESAAHRRIIGPWMRRRDAKTAYRVCERHMVEDAAWTVRELDRMVAA